MGQKKAILKIPDKPTDAEKKKNKQENKQKADPKLAAANRKSNDACWARTAAAEAQSGKGAGSIRKIEKKSFWEHPSVLWLVASGARWPLAARLVGNGPERFLVSCTMNWVLSILSSSINTCVLFHQFKQLQSHSHHNDNTVVQHHFGPYSPFYISSPLATSQSSTHCSPVHWQIICRYHAYVRWWSLYWSSLVI